RASVDLTRLQEGRERVVPAVGEALSLERVEVQFGRVIERLAGHRQRKRLQLLVVDQRAPGDGKRRFADAQHAADVGHHVDNFTGNEVNDPLLDIAQFLARVVNQPVIGEVKLPEAAGTQQLDLVRVKLKLVRAQKGRRASQQIGVQHGRVFKLACVVDEHVVYRRGS